jgi:hypothetical protein
LTSSKDRRAVLETVIQPELRLPGDDQWTYTACVESDEDPFSIRDFSHEGATEHEVRWQRLYVKLYAGSDQRAVHSLHGDDRPIVLEQPFDLGFGAPRFDDHPRCEAQEQRLVHQSQRQAGRIVRLALDGDNLPLQSAVIDLLVCDLMVDKALSAGRVRPPARANQLATTMADMRTKT